MPWFLAVLVTWGCGGGGRTSVPDSCSRHSDCPLGICLDGRCADPTLDPDHDGLRSGVEVLLGLDPLDPDTDGDGLDDGTEVGPDPAHPVDSDGDGVPDALESRFRDRDGDCLPDSADPRDDVPDATPEEVARAVCSREGVCGLHPERVAVACLDGVARCDYSAVPGFLASSCPEDSADCPEVRCDGVDNDCDGRTDEGAIWEGIPKGRPCVAPGVCGAGTVECSAGGGQVLCSSGPGGSEDRSGSEICNGLDDDCDGETDEDLWLGEAPLGGVCVGPGVCGEGVVECAADGALRCSSGPGGSGDRSGPEVCNGADDDCDGETDEDLGSLDVTGACPLKGICAAWASRVRGVCREGRIVCDYSGVPGFASGQETACDGLDEDCDGLVDENFGLADPVLQWRIVGQSCGTGACAGGQVVCAWETGPVCSTADRRGAEVCNGLDDDCDGFVDQGLAKEWASSWVPLAPGAPLPRLGPAVALLDTGEGAGMLFLQGGKGQVDPAGGVGVWLRDTWRLDLGTLALEPLADGPLVTGGVMAADSLSRRLWLVGTDASGPGLWRWEVDGTAWKREASPALDGDPEALAVDPVDGTIRGLSRAAGGIDLESWRIDPASGDLLDRRSLGQGSGPGVLAAPDPGRRRFLAALPGEAGMDLWSLPWEGSPRRIASGIPLSPAGGIAILPEECLLVLDRDGRALRFCPSGTGEMGPPVDLPRPPVDALDFPTLVSVPEGVLVLCGRLGDGSGLREILMFRQGNWTRLPLAPTPKARWDGRAAVWPRDRAAFLFGGWTWDLGGRQPAQDLWRWSLDDGSFAPVTLAGDRLEARDAATALDPGSGILYVHGGVPPAGATGQTDRFLRVSLADGVVQSLGPGPGSRRGHAMAWVGGLFLSGGIRDDQPLSDAWNWRPGAGWTLLRKDLAPRAGHAAFPDPASSRVILVGGDVGGTVEEVDPETGRSTVRFRDPRLASRIPLWAFDPDSRTLWLVPEKVDGGALVLSLDSAEPTLREHSGAQPPGAQGLLVFDPVSRGLRLFGGLPPGGVAGRDPPTSASFRLPQTCPPGPR